MEVLGEGLNPAWSRNGEEVLFTVRSLLCLDRLYALRIDDLTQVAIHDADMVEMDWHQ